MSQDMAIFVSTDNRQSNCFTPAVYTRRWGNNETLDHIPRSCLKVHVVKVVSIVRA
jgi:hypothetical protein